MLQRQKQPSPASRLRGFFKFFLTDYCSKEKFSRGINLKGIILLNMLFFLVLHEIDSDLLALWVYLFRLICVLGHIYSWGRYLPCISFLLCWSFFLGSFLCWGRAQLTFLVRNHHLWIIKILFAIYIRSPTASTFTQIKLLNSSERSFLSVSLPSAYLTFLFNGAEYLFGCSVCAFFGNFSFSLYLESNNQHNNGAPAPCTISTANFSEAHFICIHITTSTKASNQTISFWS